MKYPTRSASNGFKDEDVSVSTEITDCSFKIFNHLSKSFSLVILSYSLVLI